MKVFLGGTCNNSTWRDGLIPELNIDWFNPVVDEWSDEAYKAEIKAKNESDYFLYVLTPLYTGFYSFAEVVDESFHYPNQTIYCFLTEDGGKKFSEEEIASFQALGDKVVENGGLWLDSLEEVAEFLNSDKQVVESHDRYDFFLSYGRRHSASLASRLHHSLTNRMNRSVWLDKFNIPLGVDFQEAIDDGIKRSDNFIYVISPHSVKSEYCLKELKLAMKFGKRIIPILHVHEPGLEELMDPEIQKLNWIYFDSERKFQHSLSQLVQMVDLDRDYVEEHTKWLQKAVVWEEHNKERDFLLSETETILAKNWLEDSLEKEKSPAPSEMHQVYIGESEAGIILVEKRKRRNALLIRALSVLMAVGMVVALWFYFQAQNAREEAEIATDQAIAEKLLADKLRVEAEELKVLADDEAEAARAATKQARIERKKAEERKKEALVNEAQAIHEQWAAEKARDEAVGLRREAENAKRGLQTTLDQLEQETQAKDQAMKKANASAKQAAEERDKANELKTIADIESGSYLSIQLMNQGKIQDGAQMALDFRNMMPDTLIPANYTALVEALSHIGGDKLSSSQHSESIKVITAHGSQNVVAAGDEEGVVNLFSPKQGELLQLNGLEFTQGTGTPIVTRLRALAFNSDQSLLACGGAQGNLEIYNVKGGQLSKPVAVDTSGSKKAITHLSFILGGGSEHLLVAKSDGLYSTSSSNWSTLQKIKELNNSKVCVNARTNTMVYSLGNKVYHAKLTLAAGKLSVSNDRELPINHNGQKVSRVCLNKNDQEVVLGYGNGEVRLYNIGTGKSVSLNMGHSGRISALDLANNTDGSLLVACSSYDGTISLLRLTSSRSNHRDVATRINAHDGKWVYDLAFNDTGRYLLTVGEDRKVRQWTVDIDEIVLRIDEWLKGRS